MKQSDKETAFQVVEEHYKSIIRQLKSLVFNLEAENELLKEQLAEMGE